MNARSPTSSELINYLRAPKKGAAHVDELDRALTDVLKFSLNPKELCLVLFHAASSVVKDKAYGDKDVARDVIAKHIPTWVGKAINDFQIYNAQTISQMMSAFEMLNLRPPQRFAKFVEAQATDLMPQYQDNDMMYTLSAVAKLGLHFGKEFYDAVQKRMPDIQDKIDTKNYCRLLHQLAIIDCVNEKFDGNQRAPLREQFDRLFSNPATQRKLNGIKENSYRVMLFDAVFWFRGHDLMSNSVQKADLSSYKVAVEAAFTRAGAQILPPQKMSVTASFNNVVFDVKCDGETHHVRSMDDHKVFLNGNTILQTSLIAKRDPDKLLVRLPYDVFNKNGARKQMTEDLLRRISQAQSGAYLINGNFNLIDITAGYDAPAAKVV